jgi:EAL domain-containing protein (putative c-di-GMP-specific phosphodiesterase class I)
VTSRAAASSGTPRSIQDLLSAARIALDMDLAFLSHIDDGVQEFQFVANPSTALQLQAGARVPASASYCALMLRGDVPHVVPDVRGHEVLGSMAVTSDLGVGAYCGVPVRLPDGSLYGTLCGLDSEARHDLTTDQVTVLTVLSSVLGQQLAQLQREQRTASAERRELLELLCGERSRVVVQPIVDVTAGVAVGFEALSRFSERDGRPQRPDLVFAQARQLGLGPRFELAAVDAAIALLDQLPTSAYLSVNLSASTLSDEHCVEVLSAAPPERLVIELTEHDAIEDYDVTVGVLRELRGGGVRLAVDDVGAGFSSLQHILRLNPDVIKLDLSLTRSIHADPARRALGSGFVSFARELGASLVAEGVETEQERDALLDLGVELMQGYLLGRPGPPPSTDRFTRA